MQFWWCQQKWLFDLFKIKIFWNKGYDIIISVYDVISRNLSVYQFFYGKIIILFHSLSSKNRNSKVFTLNALEFLFLLEREWKGDNDSAIKEHHLFCNHLSSFDDFSVLVSNNNDFKVTLMASLLINRDHPPLNKNRHLLPSKLFDDWVT